MVAEFGADGMGLCGSSKAALVLLAKSCAAEFGPRGVPVNAVSPGPTRTEGTRAMGESLDQLASAGPARLAMLPARIATLDVPASSPKAVSSRQPLVSAEITLPFISALRPMNFATNWLRGRV